MSVVTYRLPDWLGGQPVQVVTRLIPEEWGSHVTVRIPGAVDSTDFDVPAHWLIAVKPPSIDDPVGLPLTVGLDLGSIQAIRVERGGEGSVFVTVDGDMTLDGYADAESARALARALWQSANAVEAGERA